MSEWDDAPDNPTDTAAIVGEGDRKIGAALFIASAAVGYVLRVVWLTVVWSQRLHYPFTNADLSGGKWRGEYGKLLSFVAVWGLWVYPLSLMCAYYFWGRVRQETSPVRKRFYFATAAAMILCFALFCVMRVSPLTGN